MVLSSVRAECNQQSRWRNKFKNFSSMWRIAWDRVPNSQNGPWRTWNSPILSHWRSVGFIKHFVIISILEAPCLSSKISLVTPTSTFKGRRIVKSRLMDLSWRTRPCKSACLLFLISLFLLLYCYQLMDPFSLKQLHQQDFKNFWRDFFPRRRCVRFPKTRGGDWGYSGYWGNHSTICRSSVWFSWESSNSSSIHWESRN